MAEDDTEALLARTRVAAYRARLRQQGLRPVQLWVPDVRTPAFARAANEQSAAIAAGEQDADDQAFVDAISWNWTADEDGGASRAEHE